MPTARKLFWGLLAVILATATLAASDTQIRGVVTDNAGKPVRGAVVKATAGTKSVSRFTQADGRYEISLPRGSYSVTAEAYGFNPKRQDKNASEMGETNFSLTPGFSLARLTGAELETLLPVNQEIRIIRGVCYDCHGFGVIQRKSGYTAAEWQSFIPVMTRGRITLPKYTPVTPGSKMTALTQALEKYFGPDAPFIGPGVDPPRPDQVKRSDLSDAVLSATIREYTIPTGLDSMPHSVLVTKSGDVWFSEIGFRATKVGRFRVGSEEFDEYAAPPHPHTGVEGKDGRIWMTLTRASATFGASSGPDLVSIDAETGKLTPYTLGEKGKGTHTTAVDSQGNIWISGSSVWKFDVKTHKFKEYKIPVPATYPENSIIGWQRLPGEPPMPIESTSAFYYDVKVDSKDKVWVSAYSLGDLIRIDPLTGETKVFHAPDTPSIRGIDVDAEDNIWFSGFDGNALGKLYPQTGTFKLYRPPTRFAMPYGVTVDKRTGNVWFSDFNGNNITRFDPKSEQFAEYPIPSNNSSPRFISVDHKGRVWFGEYMNGKIGVIEP